MQNSLSISNLLKVIESVFNQIKDPRPPGKKISLRDHLMSGFAIFSLKYPSLLKYDQERKRAETNLKNLYGIHQAPSDTYLRERLDEINPRELRRCFTRLFSTVQRANKLEAFQHIKGTYLFSLDASGHFSSKTVHCKHCC